MLGDLSLAQIVLFAFFSLLALWLILVIRAIARLGREEERREKK